VGVYNQDVKAIPTTGPPATVATGAAAYPLVALDEDHFATEQGDAVSLFDSSGTLLRTIAITPGKHRGFALDGSILAVLTGGKLEAYNIDTGQLVSSATVASKSAVLTDLQSGLAVYLAGRRVHVVRLADGRDRVLARTRKAVLGAQLERPGLWYAFNARRGARRGRVVFIPWRTVRAKLG
jgi:hypothetical protein